MAENIGKFLKHIFIFPIRLYQKIISPHLQRSCLYTPSCSEYSIKSFEKHGIIGGFILSLFRILRCNGFLFIGGVDDVPERFSFGYVFSKYREFFKYRKRL